MFTKTDLLVYEIETTDVNNNFCKHKEMFDFSSEYSKDSKLYNEWERKVISKWKMKQNVFQL